MGPPKQNIVEDLIVALRDQRVLDALSQVVVQPLLDSIAELKKDVEKKTTEIQKLKGDLYSATQRIEVLEQYTRRDNLLITGLPIETFTEAASTPASDDEIPSNSVEQSVLQLFNEKLRVSIKPSDISIAHRLKKNPSRPGPPTTIVKFTNRKAREAVYAARRKLKPPPGADRSQFPLIFINEDLCKSTAAIFQHARQAAKARQIHTTWTSSCSVFVKETPDPSCRPRKITSLSELQELLHTG